MQAVYITVFLASHPVFALHFYFVPALSTDMSETGMSEDLTATHLDRHETGKETYHTGWSQRTFHNQMLKSHGPL